MREKILFVSYNHGDNTVADSVQNHRLISALSHYYDIDILQRRFKGAEIGVASPNIYIVDRIIYKLFPFSISLFCLDKWLWCRAALKYIIESLKEYKCVVMVYEPYCTRHLQFMLKRRSLAKIVSILYDPYLDNIFFSSLGLSRALRRIIEAKIVKYSDVVVLNSRLLYKTFLERYDSGSFTYIPFCSPPPRENNSIKLLNEKVTIVHAGNIHGERHVDDLNKVVSMVKQQYNGCLADHLQILMFGNCPEEEQKKVVKEGNDNIILFQGFITYDELSRYEDNCDALLLINPVGRINYSYPSKLCEYFQINKIVFSIGSLGSAANDDLLNAGHIVCDENHLDSLVSSILLLLKDRLSFDTKIDKSYYHKFLPEKVALEYHRIINAL